MFLWHYLIVTMAFSHAVISEHRNVAARSSCLVMCGDKTKSFLFMPALYYTLKCKEFFHLLVSSLFVLSDVMLGYFRFVHMYIHVHTKRHWCIIQLYFVVVCTKSIANCDNVAILLHKHPLLFDVAFPLLSHVHFVRLYPCTMYDVCPCSLH